MLIEIASGPALGHQRTLSRRHARIACSKVRTTPLRKLCAALAGVPVTRSAQKVAFCALVYFFTGFICVGQQPKYMPINNTIKGEPPAVTMNPRGCPVLTLSEQQRAAVAKFQQAHPLFEMYNYTPSDYSDGSCLDVYQQWHMSASGDKTIAQYPFAVWGDFNHDGFLDFTVFFVSKKPAVTHKWPMNGKFVYTYEYDWMVAVFQGSQNGDFSPVIAGRDRWARAMDGVVFNIGRRRIEYWFKTAGGSVQWTGTGYRMTPMKSTD
jgi:hypothetical protein